MSLIPTACIEFKDRRKICVAIENRKKYELNNPSSLEVIKVKVDGCIPQNAGEKRCDFLMDVQDKRVAYFIELKGGDLNTAVKQIYGTIIYLKPEFKSFRLEARIVGSKDVPAFSNTPDYKKLAREVLPTGGLIKRGTNNFYSETL